MTAQTRRQPRRTNTTGDTLPPVRVRPPGEIRLGRPRLLNEETQSLIVGALRVGGTVQDAAAVAGVSEQVIHSWRARGEQAIRDLDLDPAMAFDADEILARIPESEHAFVEFSWLLQSIRGQRNVAWLEAISRDRDWHARAWLLKHHEPERYGDRLDIGVQVDVEIHDPKGRFADQVRRLREGAIEVTAREAADE